MLPWAYCVIIDLSHYANAEKQLVCVCERVCGAVFFKYTGACVCWLQSGALLLHQLLRSSDERADKISQARAFSR